MQVYLGGERVRVLKGTRKKGFFGLDTCCATSGSEGALSEEAAESGRSQGCTLGDVSGSTLLAPRSSDETSLTVSMVLL